jgi:hypothetical protein
MLDPTRAANNRRNIGLLAARMAVAERLSAGLQLFLLRLVGLAVRGGPSH